MRGCLYPLSCQAKGSGLCRHCHAIWFTRTDAHKARASKRMSSLNKTPEAAQRSSEGCLTRYFQRLEQAGITREEEPTYRILRNKRFSAKEAAEIVIGSRR